MDDKSIEYESQAGVVRHEYVSGGSHGWARGRTGAKARNGAWCVSLFTAI